MKGMPHVLETRLDWVHAYIYVRDQGTEAEKKEFVERLKTLREAWGARRLKEGAVPEGDPPVYKDEDYEVVNDPASALARSGLTRAQIDEFIAQMRFA